jgi:hypothetical protein
LGGKAQAGHAAVLGELAADIARVIGGFGQKRNAPEHRHAELGPRLAGQIGDGFVGGGHGRSPEMGLSKLYDDVVRSSMRGDAQPYGLAVAIGGSVAGPDVSGMTARAASSLIASMMNAA